jgi:hypothetical protein
MAFCLRRFLTPQVWKQARRGLARPRKGARWDFHHLVLLLLAAALVLWVATLVWRAEMQGQSRHSLNEPELLRLTGLMDLKPEE